MGLAPDQASEERDGIGTDGIDRVAAFLEDDDRQVELANGGPDASVVIGRDRQVRNRVALERVEAERDDERRVGVVAPDGGQAHLERGEVRVAIGPGREWNVQVAALPGSNPVSEAYPE